MIDMLLAEGALGDAAPRQLQCGAAPIDPATLTAALRALPDTSFVQIFGQTEISPLTALTHDDHLRALAGRPDLLTTVGRAVAGVRSHARARLSHCKVPEVVEIVDALPRSPNGKVLRWELAR